MDEVSPELPPLFGLKTLADVGEEEEDDDDEAITCLLESEGEADEDVQTGQVQNAHTQSAISLYSSQRLVYIFPHLPGTQKIPQVCLLRHSL